MKALLLQLEFPTWKTARPWTYGASFSVAEGLAANGVSCLTVPIGPDVPPASPASWLSHARRFLAGRRFDQVWIWLVHASLDPQVLEWVAGLAPVRIGFVMESLSYEAEDYAWAPHLRLRAQLFAQHAEYLTHALVCDERDASDLTAQGQRPVLWWPGFVPKRFIVQRERSPVDNRAVFHGVPYGHRAHWLDHPLLRHAITFAKSSDRLTPNQQRFDVLQSAVHARLLQQPPVMEQDVRRYVDELRTVREAEFRDWLNRLSDWAAIVNLPGLTRCFGGRVFEAMAVGRPVISWEIPGRPRTTALFQDNQEILLFSEDSPDSLARQIEYALSDPKRANAIGSNGQRKLLMYHTAERRMQQVLEWIESGKEPDYGMHPVSGEQPIGACSPSVGKASPWAGQCAHAPLLNQQATEQRARRHETYPVEPMREESMSSDNFYVNLFVKAPHWSTPEPNADEAARWSKIAAFLEYIVRRVRCQDQRKQLRILDVGCGRGWLTNLATAYGICEGIEPVAGVVEWACKLFPHLRFEAGTAESVLKRPDFVPYDIVLTSEVIEHVPHGQKEAFLAQLATLLKPDGHLILTTPRGEMWEQWKAIAPPNQPVEDWVTEDQLRTLFASQGFIELGLERIHVEVPNLRYIPAPTPADLRSMNLLPIYQVWVCQRTDNPHPIPCTRPPKVSVIVPTYNRPDRLRTALASVAAQTFQDFEVIVVNDAGCDVGFVVAACADRHRITTITHDRNRGLAAARNSGLRAAKGTYIAYLDDDDRYLPHHLETLVTYLDRRQCRVAYTDASRVYERQIDGEYVETGRDVPYSYEFSPVDLLVNNYFPVLCVMHARQCVDEVGFFDESLFAHEDWDLWIRMATRFPFKHLAVTTAEFTWRSDGTSMTSGTRDTYRRTTEIIYRKYAPHAALIAGVREAQQQHLGRFHAKTSAKTYACSIIVPVWNRLAMTRDCLTALSQIQDQPEYEVIVVDNGSTDGTQNFLHSLGGDVQVILNKENLGFAKACNQGAQAAKGRYLVFLNNDTIPQPGWLSSLVLEADAHPDGTIQHAGVVRDCQHLLPYHIYKFFAGDHPAVNKRREFQIVTAACLLIRRSIFEEVGGFDEGYVNGFEDADLCLKVKACGHAVVYQPRSVVVHLESQTSGRKMHENANAARFLDRWGAQWWAADEDRHFYVDGYKLKRVFRNEQLGGDIQLVDDVKDGAAWAHVAATQTAALRKDWQAVRHELALANDWPDDPFVLSWGAMVAERLQESDSRTKLLLRYLTLVDAPAERLGLIRAFIEQKNLVGAEGQLQILLASSPNHAEGLLLRGILSMQREQYGHAEEVFALAVQEGADRKKCLMGMGMAAMGRAYTQGAWERFLQVLAEHPDDAEAIHWLLRAGTAQNRWQELGEHFRVYVARNPGDLAARFALASVLLRDEQIEAARREYDALVKVAPNYDGLDQLGQAITGREAALAMEAASF
jgi:GT2 family glycosyltransferase/SAM-dependent methyltransferase/tetratricopeptide (TPR) repeat protein